jgi:hypothetical protein
MRKYSIKQEGNLIDQNDLEYDISNLDGIGIISLPDLEDSHSVRHKILKTLCDTYKLIYLIILLP